MATAKDWSFLEASVATNSDAVNVSNIGLSFVIVWAEVWSSNKAPAKDCKALSAKSKLAFTLTFSFI